MLHISTSVEASDSVFDFYKIWYDDNIGFNKDGIGDIFFIITYINNSYRNITSCVFEYQKKPFYLNITFSDDENVGGYIYFNISEINITYAFASKDVMFDIIEFEGIDCYRVSIPDFNSRYSFKDFIEPDKDKWFTIGSETSVEFEKKEMFIRVVEQRENGIIFDCSHPTNESAQVMKINKSYLSNLNINNPYFEWGEKRLWRVIGFEENSTHYFVYPPSFSLIGIHEPATGITSMRIKADNTIIWTNNTGSPSGQLQNYGWQSFKEPISEVLLFDIYQHDGDVTIKWGLTYENDTWIPGSTITVDCKSGWNRIDIPDTCIDFNVTHKMRGEKISGYMYWGHLYGNPYPNGRSDLGSDKDYLFRLKGSNEYYKNGTSRIAGATSERNIVDIITRAEYVAKKTVMLKVPVSNKVKGITEVLNQTTMTKATEVEYLEDVVNNTFYYDSANQFVYIGTTNLSKGQKVNWSINCTYGAYFNLTFPSYLLCGDYIISSGLIKDVNGNPISGVISKTYILDENGTRVIDNVEWNCTHGNYLSFISTNPLPPGKYDIVVEFIDPTGIIIKKSNRLYLSYLDTPTGIFSDAVLYFNFYNTNRGLGLDRETLKLYVDGTRVENNKYHTHITALLNITVKDYYNFTLYNTSFAVKTSYNFLDIGLTFHSYKFNNKQDKYYMVSIKKENATRWWEKGVCPYETLEFLLPSGNYTIRVYDKEQTEMANFSEKVNTSKIFIIHGNNISEVLVGQDKISENLLEFRAEFRKYTKPDIVKIVCDPPSIYSIFDTEGAFFGIKKICPALVYTATATKEVYANYTNTTATMPKQSLENGTVLLKKDFLYLEGKDNISVNITYTQNGTIFSNTTYKPDFFELFGENLTINASENITIKRKTTFQQIKEFYWDKYVGSGKYEASVNISNDLENITYKDVYIFIEFANDTFVDYSTVKVYDEANKVWLKRGENFDVSLTGIHLYLSSLPTYRVFKCEYYSIAEVLPSAEKLIIISTYKYKTYRDRSYNYFQAQFINQKELPYKGRICIKFNFSRPSPIATFIVYDVNKNRELEEGEFMFTNDYLEIPAEVVGTVKPSEGRIFDCYFLFEKVFVPARITLSTPIFYIGGLGITPLMIILIFWVVSIGGAISNDRYRWLAYLMTFITLLAYYFSTLGL